MEIVRPTITLQRHVHKTDILGRAGGEEFLLILPGTALEDTEAIVQHMLIAIRQSRPLPDQVSFRYTFSACLAVAGRNDDANDVYRRADVALYAAKRDTYEPGAASITRLLSKSST